MQPVFKLLQNNNYPDRSEAEHSLMTMISRTALTDLILITIINYYPILLYILLASL